eukprot:1138687-Pelagomonas_calceolata.AAC.10
MTRASGGGVGELEEGPAAAAGGPAAGSEPNKLGRVPGMEPGGAGGRVIAAAAPAAASELSMVAACMAMALLSSWRWMRSRHRTACEGEEGMEEGGMRVRSR